MFDNADSYGMAFDDAWKRQQSSAADLGREERKQRVIGELADHPFAVNQPELVPAVAEFRLRLLGQ